MPWDSRIKSESARRLAIALIMFVLLLLSTVAAAWLSAARSPARAAEVMQWPDGGLVATECTGLGGGRPGDTRDRRLWA